MNGRLYDAKLGRFLSPDNFVQDPFSTQSFNRYGYVVNNPLSYVDESGEFFFIPIIIGALIGAYSGYKIGEAHGATGWKMFGYVLGGATIGGVSGYLGGQVAAVLGNSINSAAGGLIATGIGGATSGAISGSGFAAMSGGNIFEGFWKGAVTGFVGGSVGSYIGGGIGAFVGGAVGGAVGTALYGGDSDAIFKSALIGGVVSWGSYKVSQSYGYKNYKKDGGDLTFKQYRKISVTAQRSFSRGKEKGGWLLDNGDVDIWKTKSGKDYIEIPENKPTNAIGSFHTHPPQGPNYVEGHSNYDILLANEPSTVITRKNVWYFDPNMYLDSSIQNDPFIINSTMNFNTYPNLMYWFGLRISK
jgi:hypothetical protein